VSAMDNLRAVMAREDKMAATTRAPEGRTTSARHTSDGEDGTTGSTTSSSHSETATHRTRINRPTVELTETQEEESSARTPSRRSSFRRP
jgi:hypothetical protein